MPYNNSTIRIFCDVISECSKMRGVLAVSAAPVNIFLKN